MQVTCKALYEDVLSTVEPRKVTLEHYEALRGIHGGIDRHIDASIERVIDKVTRGPSRTIAGTLQRLRGDEERMWHFVLAGLYSVSDDGAVTTRLRSLEEIEAMAREIGTQLNVSAMLDALAVPEVGLLRRAKVLEPTGELEKFSLGHDALGLSLQRWQTEDQGRLKAHRQKRVKRWANSFVLAGLVIALALASYYGNDSLETVSVGGTVAPEVVDFEDGQLPPTYRGNWMLENGEAVDAEARGSWSLATPSIDDNQVAFFELTPATGGFLDLSFDFFSDTEVCCDYLTVLADKSELGSFQLTSQDVWTREEFEIWSASDTGVVTWEYRKDGSVSEGRDRVWIDDISLSARPFEVLERINFEDGVLPSGYLGDWEVTDSDARTGTFSLATPSIGDDQVASFELPVPPGANGVMFDYRTDTESCCDDLTVILDNVFDYEELSPGQLTSVEGWNRQGYSLSDGEEDRFLLWEYRKDGSVSEGQDRIWIDNIQFVIFR